MFSRIQNWWRDRNFFTCTGCQRKLEKEFVSCDGTQCLQCYHDYWSKRFKEEDLKLAKEKEDKRLAEQRKLIDAVKIALREIETEKENGKAENGDDMGAAM